MECKCKPRHAEFAQKGLAQKMDQDLNLAHKRSLGTGWTFPTS
ncbi:MAG: hypothetical protein ACJAZ8_001365 [Planctomycetota bacterium]|jgi:hypothetical protein